MFYLFCLLRSGFREGTMSQQDEIIQQREKALAWLRAGWGEWYYFGFQGGQYFAVRKADSSTCRRAEASQLERELAADMAARPGLH